MGPFFRVFARVLTSATGIFIFVSSGAFATELPSSAIDNYRLESQYGPYDALLSPMQDRDQRLELGVGGAFAPLSSLVSYKALTASLIYNINRRHAVEPIFYSYFNGGLSSFVQKQIADKAKPSGATNADLSVEVPRQLWTASYFFSPYHSKLHLTTHSVMHFDVYFGAGAGVQQVIPLNLEKDEGRASWGAVVSVNAGMRFFFGSNFLTRLDFRNFNYSSEDFGKKSRKSDLQMGLSLGFLL
jgi:outer membrane beta-barrel protein